MPITAALSRTLHEALGREAAADLVDWMQTVDTHRAELRELSELHYARFDSRMTEQREVTDARFGALRHELRADINTLRMEMQTGLAGMRDETRASFADVREEMRGGLAGLREEMHGIRAGLREEMHGIRAGLRDEMHGGFAGLRDEMRTGFAEAKVANARLEAKIDRRFAEFVRWSFLFWCGAIAAAALARL